MWGRDVTSGLCSAQFEWCSTSQWPLIFSLCPAHGGPDALTRITRIDGHLTFRKARRVLAACVVTSAIAMGAILLWISTRPVSVRKVMALRSVCPALRVGVVQCDSAQIQVSPPDMEGFSGWVATPCQTELSSLLTTSGWLGERPPPQGLTDDVPASIRTGAVLVGSQTLTTSGGNSTGWASVYRASDGRLILYVRRTSEEAALCR